MEVEPIFCLYGFEGLIVLFVHYLFIDLECQPEDISDTPFLTGGEIEITYTAYIFDMNQFEDIVNTYNQFDVRSLRIHDMTTLGEVHQFIATRILRQEGVVLVRQVTPEHVHSNILTPLQFLDQWNTVEELSVQVPRKHHRGIAVVEELHVVDEIEHLFLNDKRLVV